MTSDVRTRPLVYTPEEAAQELKVGRSKVYELMARGELKSMRIGRSRRISATALEDFIEQQTANEIGEGKDHYR